ncbi:hypothetical protein D3C77_693080 [compost metagenome]
MHCNQGVRTIALRALLINAEVIIVALSDDDLGWNAVKSTFILRQHFIEGSDVLFVLQLLHPESTITSMEA